MALFTTCTPRHHPPSPPHFRPLLQECSESPQVKRTLWAFSRKRMRQKLHLLTQKLVNAHLKPASRVRQNTSYIFNWLICGVFDKVSNFQATSTNSTQQLNIVIMMTSRHLCPGSDHTHSCNGRQAPRRIPQPEKNWARVSAHLLLREGIQKKRFF